jgi:predicted esterase
MVQERHIDAVVRGRYLIAGNRSLDSQTLLVGFHGYGESADIMLARLQRVAPEAFLLCSIQALHPFYTKNQDVVASWMTSLDREYAIENNQRFVKTVLAEVLNAAPNVCSVKMIGYSQGAAMAYRSALTGEHPVDSLIIIGGDLPPELQSIDARSMRSNSILLCRGEQDPHFSSAQLAQDCAFFTTRGISFQVHEYQGQHPWNDALDTFIAAYLAAPTSV